MGGTYKVIQIVGTSTESLTKAIESGVKEASKTVRNMRWFEVVEQRGFIEDGEAKEFQVKLNVGFKLDR